ncbi:MAG: hypothetical protein PF542_03500 [Nanoarchaeota archaeon]|jgi:tRNA-dependent cyclodipeptide synthase|nr:hypothetical protein [Nanoarchaeota archaeon]
MQKIIDNLKIYNGSKKDFSNKNTNIWLGVSISLKPYSEKLAKEYLKIISKYSNSGALVFIGDEIAAINYNVLEKYGKETSLKKALEKGDIFENKYRELIKTLSKEEQGRIKIIRWEDVWSGKLEEMYKIIKEEYSKNVEFKREVEAPIITYLINSKRTIKQSRVSKMSEYILKELPFLLDGVEYQNVEYKTLLYPTYGKTSLSELVSNIQNGEKYVELKNRLNIKGNHMLADSPIIETNEKGFLNSK